MTTVLSRWPRASMWSWFSLHHQSLSLTPVKKGVASGPVEKRPPIANEKKAGGIAGALAVVGGAVALAVHTLGGAAEDIGHVIPDLSHSDATALLHPTQDSATAIGAGLTDISRENQGDKVFVSALCNAVANTANNVPPDENVGDTLKSAIAEYAGIPLYLPRDKLNQLEGALHMSQWNGAVASRYLVACHSAGIP